MSSVDPAITVYRLQACPFCERVVRKLREYDLSYRSRFVEPMHSDRNVVKRLTGKRSVPALVDESTGVTMSESGNIVEYLDATYGPTAARRDGSGEPATTEPDAADSAAGHDDGGAA
ncbi:MAG: glutaredoxin family protein [Halobacteriota archaeon]